LTVFEEAGCVTVEVTDSGSGISKENQMKLFANVIQFNARAQQGGGGSGLGLWISAKIMAIHGGEIGVRSEGKGSTFFIKIPVSNVPRMTPEQFSGLRTSIRVHPEASFEAKVQRRLALRNSGSHSLNNRLRILIVDDSALNRRIIKRLIAADGYTGDEADDGAVAIEMTDVATSEVTYDLILMDNLMPNVSGPAASQELRTRGFEGVIVGITGNAAAAEIEDFIQHGADAVLPKPVNVEHLRRLIALINEDFEKKHAQAELTDDRLHFGEEEQRPSEKARSTAQLVKK
jgi:CheY-like chemotaxis protein